MNLSDLVLAEGYGFLVTPAPHLRVDVLGNPPGRETFSALVCNDWVDGPYIACLGDFWDHVYSVSHEIAEQQRGFKHTCETFEYQANVLARWCRRLGFENERLAAGVDNKGDQLSD